MWKKLGNMRLLRSITCHTSGLTESIGNKLKLTSSDLPSCCPCEITTTIRVTVTTLQKRPPLCLISLPYMSCSFKALIKPCWLVLYFPGRMRKLIKSPSRDGVSPRAASHYTTDIYIGKGRWCVWGDCDTSDVCQLQQVVIIFQLSGFNGVWLAPSRMSSRAPWPFPVDTSRKTNGTHLLPCHFTADRDVPLREPESPTSPSLRSRCSDVTFSLPQSDGCRFLTYGH